MPNEIEVQRQIQDVRFRVVIEAISPGEMQAGIGFAEHRVEVRSDFENIGLEELCARVHIGKGDIRRDHTSVQV